MTYKMRCGAGNGRNGIQYLVRSVWQVVSIRRLTGWSYMRILCVLVPVLSQGKVCDESTGTRCSSALAISLGVWRGKSVSNKGPKAKQWALGRMWQG